MFRVWMFQALAVAALCSGCGESSVSPPAQDELSAATQQVLLTPTGDPTTAELVIRGPGGQALPPNLARLLLNGRSAAFDEVRAFSQGQENVLVSLHTPGFPSFGVDSSQVVTLQLGFRTELELASLRVNCNLTLPGVTIGGRPTIEMNGLNGTSYKDTLWCGGDRVLLPGDYRLTWLPLDIFGPGEVITLGSGDSLVKDFTEPDQRVQVVITAPVRRLPGNTTLQFDANHLFSPLRLDPAVPTTFTAIAGELIFAAGRTYSIVDASVPGQTYQFSAERLDIDDVDVAGLPVRGSYTLSLLDEKLNRWLPIDIECGAAGDFKRSCPTGTGTDVAHGNQYKVTISYVTAQGPQQLDQLFDFR